MTNTPDRVCAGCEQPITADENVDAHDVSDVAARRHNVDPGLYHDRCCAMCERVTT